MRTHLLVLAAEPKLGGAEQPVDHVVVLPHAVVDQLALAVGTEHEERRQLALADAAWHLDEHPSARRRTRRAAARRDRRPSMR